MRTMEGVVTLVQESRFQMVDDGGVYHNFLLSHGAAAEPADLAPLQARQARVRVGYRQAPNMIARIAHRIELCDTRLSKQPGSE